MIKNILIFLCVSINFSVFCNEYEQQKLYDRTVKYLDRGGIYLHYENLDELPERFKALLEILDINHAENSLQHTILKNILSGTGLLQLNELQSFGYSTKRLNKNLYSNKLFVTTEPSADGILCALPGKKNVSFAEFANLPCDTVFAAGAYWDWQKVYSVLEKKYSKDDNFKSMSMMLEMSTGAKASELMKNITGKYFGGIFKGKEKNEFHYLVILPDRYGLLKKILLRNTKKTLRKKSDGSVSLQIPIADNFFGNTLEIDFDGKNVFLHNSHPDIKSLLNLNGRKKKLLNFKPEIYTDLRKMNGNSFMMMNFDPTCIDSGTVKNIYCYSSLCTANADGYLVSSMSNFNLQDLSKYTPIFNAIPYLRQMLEAAEDDDEQ